MTLLTVYPSSAWCRRKDLMLLAENHEFDDLMQSSMAVIASQKKWKKGNSTDYRVAEIVRSLASIIFISVLTGMCRSRLTSKRRRTSRYPPT